LLPAMADSQDLNAELPFIEESTGDHAGKHEIHLKEIEIVDSKLQDINTTVSGEKINREKLITSLEEQLQTPEKQVTDTAKKQCQQLDNMELTQKKLSRLDSRIDSLEGAIGESRGKHDKLVANGKTTRDGHHATIGERLNF